MQVKLPKFKLDFNQDLQEAMTNMGKMSCIWFMHIMTHYYNHNGFKIICLIIYINKYVILLQSRSRNAI